MNLRIVSGLLIAPIGFILFSVWRANQNISSLLGSFDQYSQIIFVTPLTGIFLAIRQFLETGSLLVLGELLSLLLFGAILGWMIGQKRFQIYPSMLIYSVGLVVLFLSKHSYSASAMQSSARYVLAIFPAFIGIGHLVDHLSSRYQKLVKLSSFFLLLLVSAIYGFGFFVGWPFSQACSRI